MFVRRATELDIDDIVTIAHEMHNESPLHCELPFDEDQVAGLLGNALRSEQWLVQMAVVPNDIAGASLTYVMPTFFGPALESGDLAFYVRPGFRGSKAAIMLTEGIIEWATLLGARRFTMGVHTGIDHERTRQFLLRAGFTETGIMMQRLLE